MASDLKSRISEIIEKFEAELLHDWLREQLSATTLRTDLLAEGELRQQSAQFLRCFKDAVKGDAKLTLEGPLWAPVYELLEEISRARARQGFSPTETATFIFSFKQPLFARIAKGAEGQTERVREELWLATTILDRLGLHTLEAYQKSREEVIKRQQSEMLELSTPVVQLWDGIVALPIIGTLDSKRTQSAMESLLQRIVETGAEYAIIDITGVPTVDTLTAQHLLKTITATRLMGAECILSGIRPQIAQTIVHLGVELGGVLTKASLASALQLAFARRGLSVSKAHKNLA